MKHFVTAFGSSLVTRGLGALTMLLLIRAVPEAEFARLSVVVGVVTAASAMVTTPFNHIYILYRREEGGESQAAFLAIQLGLTLVLGLLALPLANWTGWLYPLGCAWCVGLVCNEFSRTVRQHRLEFGLYGLYEFIRTAGILGLTLLWIALHPGGVSAASFVAISAAVTLLVAAGTALPILRAEASAGAVLRSSGIAVYGRPFLLLALYFGLIAILAQTDILMLGALAPADQVATYGAAIRYYQVLLIAMGAAYVVILPSVNRAQSIADLQLVFKRFRGPALILIATIMIAWLAAGWLIPLLDKGRYPGSVPIFRILALSAAISIVSAPYASVLLKRRDLRFLVLLAAVALAADLALTGFLIPRFGGQGAAFATTVCTALVTISVRLRAHGFLADRSGFAQQNPEALAGGRHQGMGGESDGRDERRLP